jgi:phenylalanyl-tRNA synthetase alpha chain
MPDAPSLDSLKALQSEALAALAAAADDAALEAWRVGWLGRSGRLTGVLRGLGALAPEERRAMGAAANEAKGALEAALEARHGELTASRFAGLATDTLDVSLPGRRAGLGRYHPSTRILREITGIFRDMGFQTVEGPEVEWDRYNFELLNIPPDHPARDMFDTFWLDTPPGPQPGQSLLLRTHTSPMQARIMEAHQPPIRVVVPGKCYRYEATDATHESQFHQVEGLVVDRGITFANLKHTLYEFARRMFGPGTRVRFRCDYFPFVEPGVDMSIEWRGRWLEILGAGMVHPNVLRGVGYDPDEVTGFAFGMGPERIAMLRYGINDIRHFLASEPRFLRQF